MTGRREAPEPVGVAVPPLSGGQRFGGWIGYMAFFLDASRGKKCKCCC